MRVINHGKPEIITEKKIYEIIKKSQSNHKNHR